MKQHSIYKQYSCLWPTLYISNLGLYWFVCVYFCIYRHIQIQWEREGVPAQFLQWNNLKIYKRIRVQSYYFSYDTNRFSPLERHRFFPIDIGKRATTKIFSKNAKKIYFKRSIKNKKKLVKMSILLINRFCQNNLLTERWEFKLSVHFLLSLFTLLYAVWSVICSQ